MNAPSLTLQISNKSNHSNKHPPPAATAGQYGSTHPAAAGGASEAEVPTTATTTTTPRASFAFGFDLHDDDDDDTAARTAGPGASGLLLEISTLLAEGDDAPSTGAAAAAAAVTCPAHRRLGPWAALLLAVAGAVVGGVGLWLGWSHATLLPVLVPCALLAFWPLLPALRRAARRRYVCLCWKKAGHTDNDDRLAMPLSFFPYELCIYTHPHKYRRTDTAALVAIGVGAALLLGHPGAALTMLAMALLAERVNTAADACVARSLGGSRGMRLPKVGFGYCLSWTDRD